MTAHMTARWIKRVWRSIRSASSVAGSRRFQRSDRGRPEHLETRCLLAGNVSVSLSAAAAVITGDGQANDLELVAVPGSLLLRGRNGTTINGSQSPFTLSSSGTTFQRQLQVHLGAGNDVFSIGSDIRFGRLVQIDGQAGDDTISVTGSNFDHLLSVSSGTGNDSVVFSRLTAAGPVSIAADGSLQFATADSTLQRSLTVNTAAGADSAVVTGSTIGGSVVLLTGAGDDNIAIQNSTLRSSLYVDAGRGRDVVLLDGAKVTGPASLWMRQGNDSIILQGQTILSRRLTVGALLGTDQLEIAGTATTGRVRKLGRPGSLAETAQKDRITAATTGALARAAAAISSAAPQLTATSNPTTAAETAGTAALTVTRSGSTALPLIVQLTAGGSDRITLPATLTIPAGSQSATATVTIVNNTVVDGSAAIQITAAAAGFTGGGTSLTITDDDVAAPTQALTLTPASNTLAESNSAGISITVARSSADQSAPLTVALSASGGRLTLPATVTIPAGAASTVVNATAVNDQIVNLPGSIALAATATGFTSGTASLTLLDDESPTLTLASPATIAEAGTPATVTISRNTENVTQALTVSLSATSARLNLPATITIPAGAASAQFTVTPVNDQIVNLASSQTLTATASDFASGSTSIVITDDDSPTLALSLSAATVAEGAPPVTATVSRNTEDTTQSLTVFIAIGSDRATGPATVQIPAGQTSVTFTVGAVDNQFVDGAVTAQVSASATQFVPGVTVLTVTDNDTAIAELQLSSDSSSITENSATPLTLTVTRTSTDLSQALEVTLDADSGALTVPATATIPAGQSSVDIQLETLNDDIALGSVTVTVSAIASGYAKTTLPLTVLDDEVPAISITPGQASLTEGSPNKLQLTVSRNTADISEPLTVALSSVSSRISLPGSVVIPGGSRQVQFSVQAVNDQIVSVTSSALIEASAASFTSGQSSLTVNEDDIFTLSVDPAIPSVNELIGQVSTTVSLGKAADQDIVVSLAYSQPDLLTGPASVTVPAGQLSVQLQLSVIPGSVPEGTRTGSVTATIAGTAATDSANVLVQDGDSFSLTTDVSANQTEQSSGILLTRSSSFIVNGVTAPNASIAVDSNGDGQYDDATATADSSGIYSLTVPLTADGQNKGDHRLLIRATAAAGVADQTVYVHYAVGTLIRFNTTSGTFDVELLNADAPITVANFISYQASPAYSGLIVHRSVPQFVIQGGGFTLDNGQITGVPTNPPIQNEFSAANSNVRGTLAMAMVSGNINSGTSQWFINVADNTFLDEGKYTVFGRVLGNGMTVVDQINNLTTYDLKTAWNNGALGEVPLTKAPPSGTQLTGTVSLQAGSTLLTGSGTAFTTELAVGTDIWINNRIYRIDSITSDTAAVLSAAASASATSASAWKEFLPNDADYVVFSSIDELLPLLP